MSFSNSNHPYNEFDNYFNHDSTDHKLFSKGNSITNIFNYRSSSNFSVFGKAKFIDLTQDDPVNEEIVLSDKNSKNNAEQINSSEKNIVEDKKTPPKIEEKKIKKPEKSIYFKNGSRKKKIFQSLANRNLKLNMATGMIQFIDLKRQMAQIKGYVSQYKKYDDILRHINNENYNFRSFMGWKSMWNDKKYGKAIKKISQKFFGDTFAYSYIYFSKVKHEYKKLYYSKVECFRRGSKNPESFGPYLYNHSFT